MTNVAGSLSNGNKLATDARGRHLVSMADSSRMLRLHKLKIAMLNQLGQWPPELLVVRPAADSWSALAVLDHVVRTELEIMNDVMKMIQFPAAIPMRDRLLGLMIEGIFLSPMRVKVPGSVPVVLPGPDLALDEIVARWGTTRQTLTRVAEECLARGVRGGVFRHPVSGWMSWDQVLRFFCAHLVHHQYQLKRIHKSLAPAI